MEPSSAQTSKLNGWPSNSNHMSTSGANGCTNSRNSEPPSTQTVAGLTTRMSGVSANAEVAALVVSAKFWVNLCLALHHANIWFCFTAFFGLVMHVC